MSKVHHIHNRNTEHAKSRDFAAHRLTSPGAPNTGYRSTYGFAAVKGQQPALDVQPRHGGKAKGGVVEHSWGNTEQQIARENLTHKVIEAVSGAPDASSSSPLDLMTSSQAGKRLPVPACHSGTPSRPDRGVYTPDDSGKVLGGAVISGSTKLPATVKEN